MGGSNHGYLDIPHMRGHTTKKRKAKIIQRTMTFGAWNVRTLLDRPNNLCPERKTAIVARELGRYNVDIAALSETHLADEGELVERGGGYTFFWKGTPASEPRRSGVGFAIKTTLASKLVEYPVGISDRVMFLRLHLENDKHLNIISVYSPTLDKSDDVKDHFYEELSQTLSRIRSCEKILLLGDFNARVGRDFEACPGVLGRHGIGNMNSNGQLLLTLCSQFHLAITNTMFRLPAKYKTTWMHQRSKHWHLIDYALVRQQDISDVTITRVMRGANCWSDHRLVITKMLLHLWPRRRPCKIRQFSLDLKKLESGETVDKYREAINSFTTTIDPAADNTTEAWNNLSANILRAAKEILDIKPRSSADWFDDNEKLLSDALAKHRQLLRGKAQLNLNISDRIRQSTFELRKITRTAKDEWWQNKIEYIQWLADTKQLGEFFGGIRKLVGNSHRVSVPIKSTNGTLLVSKEDVLNRWSEHFNNLLNVDRLADFEYLRTLPELPKREDLVQPPSLQEVIEAIKAQKNKKAVGVDNIPGELLKYGGDALHHKIWLFFQKMWEEEEIPSDFGVSLICAIYKNKGSRSECNSYRGISLLFTAGKAFARTKQRHL
ncbi:uncharacterized protein LOC124542503 [Vanessa cardui]|uniref:uncharacterized protein LOC124542503 n=1 Tax=Vanessa cardui TaxID=171605 RepID=UPI001F135E6E|nr:uncharacterized protein LOC124542503 [Vanessa cardui]